MTAKNVNMNHSQASLDGLNKFVSLIIFIYDNYKRYSKIKYSYKSFYVTYLVLKGQMDLKVQKIEFKYGFFIIFWLISKESAHSTTQVSMSPF